MISDFVLRYTTCAHRYMMQNVELFLRSYGRQPQRIRFRDVSERCRNIGISKGWFRVADMRTKRSQLRQEIVELQRAADTSFSLV